jgi:hypothetical protein
MRFSVAFVAGFVAMASAATTTASLDPSQASQLACLDKCDAGDVDCQSHCITVPSPDKNQVNKTTECVANCDQGSGSKSDTEKYSKCVQACISDNYFNSADGTPQQTGSSGSNSKDSSSDSTQTAASGDSTATATATNSASDSDSTDASETDEDSSSSTGTATGSSSSSTNSDSAAAGLVIGSASFLGLIAAVLAL